MLYEKNLKPFSDALFREPTAEYRGAPFWGWNGALDKEELCRQIEVFRKMGFGGFHMHVRTGLQTHYLSDEFFEMVSACIEKAASENMLAWLYDEDRWPSGQAGGTVTKNDAYRCRRLVLTREKLEENERCKHLASYAVELDEAGFLRNYKRIDRETTPRAGFAYHAYRLIDGDRNWYNGQAEVDTLNPAAIAEFLRVTHEQYAKRFGDKFGTLVPAIFTDEPAAAWKRIQPFPHEGYEMRMPWTDDLPQSFAAAFAGADVFEKLPELVWEKPDSAPSQFRYQFHDHIAQRFRDAFARQYGQWCKAHGLRMVGHLPEEDTLFGQTSAIGEAMRMYPEFYMPGVDMLSDERNFVTCKQAQSVAHQQGQEGVLSELYGVTNWDFDFRGMKQQGDWQAALGVTLRTPHLSWYTMQGEAKRDYPTTFSYQSPWAEDYRLIEDHFARLNTALTRGSAVVRIGVIHPVESYWMHWGTKVHTQVSRDKIEKNLTKVTDFLLRNTLDFDFICESILPDQCAVEDITQQLPVGQARYDVIIVPGCEMLRSTTLERLEAFRQQGGRLLFMGDVPVWCDGVPSQRGKALYGVSEHIAFEEAALVQALAPVREVALLDCLTKLNRESNIPNDIFYQLRQDGQERWLFLAQSGRNADLPKKRLLRVQIKGHWQPVLYDTLKGTKQDICYYHQEGKTVAELPVYNHDSLLLRLYPAKALAAKEVAAPARRQSRLQSFLKPVPVTLDEPNVLLLDMAEYRFDDEPWQPKEDVLRISETIRARLGGCPSAGGGGIQPWVICDNSTPHTLRLRYTFQSQLQVKGAKLALENAGQAKVLLNGLAAGNADGWYMDRSIGTVALPAILPGENVLEIRYPWGISSEAEACYLLGDFGVCVAGCHGMLTAPVRQLCFGDITRQGLEFYGGNITYHLPVSDVQEGTTLSVTEYKGAALRIAVDGKPLGQLCFAPYQLPLPALPGEHSLDITLVGCRINTLGQLHCIPWEGIGWGPDTWRTTGDRWSYEYRFRPQGILKSPELI